MFKEIIDFLNKFIKNENIDNFYLYNCSVDFNETQNTNIKVFCQDLIVDKKKNEWIIFYNVKQDEIENIINQKSMIYIKGFLTVNNLLTDNYEFNKKFILDTKIELINSKINIFRKIFLYKQDNYKLVLLFNKPENLNKYIKNIPRTKNIGNYLNSYRQYFLKDNTNNFIDERNIMIDIGANIGLSACPILSKNYTVHCFEPELINYKILKKVKEINNFNKMFIYNCVVADNNDKIDFYSNVNREDNSSINYNCSKKNVCPKNIIKKTYPCITLDKWYYDNKHNIKIKNIRLIKIDTQGSEFIIIKNSNNLLLSCSLFNNCNIELECDTKFMKENNTNFAELNLLMEKSGFKLFKEGYDSIFIPKKPIPDNILYLAESKGQICNQLKNFLSCLRIGKYLECDVCIEEISVLHNFFELSNFNYNIEKHNNLNLIKRDSWRFAVFNKDKNLDKIVNNKYSLMFKDFSDELIYKNYKYNSIDFIYNNILFNEIYKDYCEIFNTLKIHKKILTEINTFSQKYFNENTISVHIRSWVDAKKRRKNFDINNFYRIIDKYNNGENNFFIASDDINISYQIKKYQLNKNLDNIIIFNNNKFTKIENAFIDLILLSKNNLLIGTDISTFTEMAYIINYNCNKKIIIV